MEKKKTALDEKQKMKDLIAEHIQAKKDQNQQIKDEIQKSQELIFDIKDQLQQITIAQGECEHDYTSNRNISLAGESEGNHQM